MKQIEQISTILDKGLIRNLFIYKRATHQDLTHLAKLSDLCNPEHLPDFDFGHYMVQSPIANDIWKFLIKRDFQLNREAPNLSDALLKNFERQIRQENKSSNTYNELYHRLASIEIITDLLHYKRLAPSFFNNSTSLDAWDGFTHQEKFDNLAQYDILCKIILSSLAKANHKDVTAQRETPMADAIRRADRHTPLIIAIKYGRSLMLESLIAQGADVNLADSKGYTPLQYAISNVAFEENITNIKLLLENGANPNIKDKSGNFLMDIAVAKTNVFLATSEFQKNCKKAVMLLIEYGANIHRKNDYFGTPELNRRKIHAQVLIMEYGDGSDQLENYISSINPISLVEWAIHHKHADILGALISKGENIHEKNKVGKSPLLMAVESRDVASVRLLLINGASADVSMSDNYKNVPVITASGHGDIEILFLLLAAGGDPQAAMSPAAFCGDINIMRRLLPLVNVNQPYEKKFCLHSAILGGHLDMVKLLLEAGADPSQQSSRWNALELAKNTSPEMHNLILNRLNNQNRSGLVSYLWGSSSTASSANVMPRANDKANGQCNVM